MRGYMYNRKIYLSRFKCKYNVYVSSDPHAGSGNFTKKLRSHGSMNIYTITENWLVCTPLHHLCKLCS